MGYSIAAVIASMKVLGEDRSGLPVVALEDGWGLVPFPEWDPDPDPDVAPTADDKDATVRRLSAAGPVAFVRADIHAGRGTQEAVVVRDGAVVFGPVDGWIGDGPTPISRALAALGVEARGRDEFGTLRLDRHRHTADWLSDAV